MDKYRQIAFIAAFVVAILVMMLGKACTDKIINNPVRPAQTATQQSTPAQNFNSYNNYNNGYNNVQAQTTATAPEQTAPPVNYVTNMFGEIIGTEPAETIETVPEIQTTTEERSILEQYNADKPQNNTPAENSDKTPAEIHITIH